MAPHPADYTDWYDMSITSTLPPPVTTDDSRITFGEVITMLVSLIFWVVIFIGCCFGCKKMCQYMCCEIPEAYCGPMCRAIKTSPCARALYYVVKKVCNVDLEARVRAQQDRSRGSVDNTDDRLTDPPPYDVALSMPKPVHNTSERGVNILYDTMMEIENMEQIIRGEDSPESQDNGASASNEAQDGGTGSDINNTSRDTQSQSVQERNNRNRVLESQRHSNDTSEQITELTESSGIVHTYQNTSIVVTIENTDRTESNVPHPPPLPSDVVAPDLSDGVDTALPGSSERSRVDSTSFTNMGFISDDGLPSYGMAMESIFGSSQDISL